jgi:hypothetical protein
MPGFGSLWGESGLPDFDEYTASRGRVITSVRVRPKSDRRADTARCPKVPVVIQNASQQIAGLFDHRRRGQNGNVSPIRAVLLLAQKPGSISRAF